MGIEERYTNNKPGCVNDVCPNSYQWMDGSIIRYIPSAIPGGMEANQGTGCFAKLDDSFNKEINDALCSSIRNVICQYECPSKLIIKVKQRSRFYLYNNISTLFSTDRIQSESWLKVVQTRSISAL